MKQDILNRLNAIIDEEKGISVGMNDMFLDSQLDSLGIMLTILTLETDFPFLKNVDDEDTFTYLDIPNLTVRDLIKKCVLSITTTSLAPTSEMAT